MAKYKLKDGSIIDTSEYSENQLMYFLGQNPDAQEDTADRGIQQSRAKARATTTYSPESLLCVRYVPCTVSRSEAKTSPYPLKAEKAGRITSYFNSPLTTGLSHTPSTFLWKLRIC